MALNPTDAPIFDNTIGADFRGGYNGEQVLSSGGGYNPSSPSAYLTGTDSIGGTAAISQDYMAGKDNFAGGYYGEQVEKGGGGASFESEAARKSLLPSNAADAATKNEPSVAIQDANAAAGAPSDDDWRVRISLADKAEIFYKATGTNPNTLMDPLRDTNGVVFPYTPSIQMSHVANYSQTSPTHSNYAQQFYNNSEVSDITLTGEFTVQGIDEGKYLLAAIYFFRSATKMFFGQGANAGNPPPIVFLDGYGSHYFPHVPCVITNFTHTMSNEVDYIQIPVTTTTLSESTVAPSTPMSVVNTLDNEGMKWAPNMGRDATATNKAANTTKTEYKSVVTSTRVPTSSTIMVTLKPVYSRKNLHDNFNLDSFAAGRLVQTSTTGGFI